MIFQILWVFAVLTLVPVQSIAEPVFDPLLLNIRMSSSALHPPAELVKQRWTLEGYRLGRLGPQAPRAAIIEDDARQRLLILSSTDEGTVLVYRMGDLPVDVARRLPQALACSRTRQCQNKRNDPAGELGCLSLCLLEHLTE
ncbi:MAG TPA: hypothetical protein VGQ07_02345 [Nitrospirales bacterium]|nr:hypothetical protein [Nitrospirales bacterium]